MLESVRGKLIGSFERGLILEVGSWGVRIFLPRLFQDQFSFRKEEELFFYLFPLIREQEWALYGFLRMEEREFFSLLLSVSGIGPKVALSFFDIFSLEELLCYFRDRDISSLIKVPGVGKKSIERILLETREKTLQLASSLSLSEEKGGNDLFESALSALIHLGFSRERAEKAILRGKRESCSSGEKELAGLIRSSLKYI